MGGECKEASRSLEAALGLRQSERLIVGRTGNGEIREPSKLVAELARRCHDLEGKLRVSSFESLAKGQPAE